MDKSNTERAKAAHQPERIGQNESCRYVRRGFPGECSRTRCIRSVSGGNRKEKSMSDNHTHSQMALLVMDVQAGIVTRFAQTGDFLERMNTAITAARAAQIPVIYVVVAFRPGYPEISPRNKSFSA